jgi:hypothetical protein
MLVEHSKGLHCPGTTKLQAEIDYLGGKFYRGSEFWQGSNLNPSENVASVQISSWLLSFAGEPYYGSLVPVLCFLTAAGSHLGSCTSNTTDCRPGNHMPNMQVQAITSIALILFSLISQNCNRCKDGAIVKDARQRAADPQIRDSNVAAKARSKTIVLKGRVKTSSAQLNL